MATHILIVEDDPLIAMDLEAIAREAGVEPTCCATVREAFAVLGAHHYALALLDIDVPDGKTFPVAERLVEARVPVYFVSASRRIDIPSALAAAPLLPKPYRVAELRSAIGAHA